MHGQVKVSELLWITVTSYNDSWTAFTLRGLALTVVDPTHQPTFQYLHNIQKLLYVTLDHVITVQQEKRLLSLYVWQYDQRKIIMDSCRRMSRKQNKVKRSGDVINISWSTNFQSLQGNKAHLNFKMKARIMLNYSILSSPVV